MPNSDKQILGHPAGLFILFFTEMWERFSYYGMRGLLVLYVSASITAEDPGMGWSTRDALWLYGWYTMLVYLMSIPGGILADRFLGQKKAVMIGGILLVAGHTTLAIPSNIAFFAGIILIILGVGFLKPNISTMVGGLYKQGDIRRDKGFSIFYVGINLGAFLAGIIVGIVAKEYGWHYGFGLAGIGMVAGQLVYVWGQRYLVTVGNSPRVRASNAVVAENKPLTREEKDRVVVLLISFLIVVIFWGAFEQAGGLMNLYTDVKIDRTTGINTSIAWLKEIPTVVFQSLNSTYIMIFATLVAGFWAWRRSLGKEASSLFKMAIGTIVMGAGFLFMMIASKEASAEAFGKASMTWIFLTYLFHTLGELSISPVAMSFITKLSPAKYASVMMGIYFAATGIGNKLAATVGESSQTKSYEASVVAPKEVLNQFTGKQIIDEKSGLVGYPIDYDKNVSMKASLFLEKRTPVFYKLNSKERLNSIFQFDQTSWSRLIEELGSNEVSRGNPYHAELLFEKEKSKNNVEGDGKNYQVSFVIEEIQSEQEYNTFKHIAIFTAVFSLLLIVFLKKLKRLTHGVEESEGKMAD